jgi:hypothetical protein
MCEVHDLIPDIESIAISGVGYVEAISISFCYTGQNSMIDLPMNFILAITGLKNSVVVQWVLGYGLPNGIMPCPCYMVLKLIYVKVYSFILGVLEGVIHIDWVQGL